MSTKEKSSWCGDRACLWRGGDFKEGPLRSLYGKVDTKEQETPEEVCERDHVDIRGKLPQAIR